MQQLKIGRDKSCEIYIDDATVSRKHATLIISGNIYSIRDEQSTNGTFVNGNRISGTVRLNEHDIVKAGNTVIPWRKYITVNKTADVVRTNKDTGERKKRKKRVTNAWIASSVILLVLISMIIYFFYISQRDELRINATWVCDENCQDLKRVIFDKGKDGKGDYSYIAGVGFSDTTRGTYNMDMESGVLKLSKGLSSPVPGFTAVVDNETSYKYEFKKNKLSLIVLEDGIKKGNEINLVKLR